MFRGGWALPALCLLGLVLRFGGFERVFVDGDTVVFYLGDAYYHARRALETLAHFPRVVGLDPYLNFPHGAVAPSPPGYDLLVVAIAGALGGSERALERVSAVLPPLIGAATVLPTFALGVRIGGRRVGWLAAFLVATLPANAVWSLVGYADHHAAVTFVAGCWLALAASLAAGAGSLAARCAALAVVRLAVLWTWSGSLLYLAIGDASLILALVATRAAPATLYGVAISLIASAAATAPLVAVAPLPPGGPLSAVNLSWLQPLACAALAGWSALMGRRARGEGASALRRSAEAIGVGLALAALPAALPALRRSLLDGLAFVAKLDAWGGLVIEQLPLFSSAPSAVPATMLFGWLAHAVPIAPLLALRLALDRASRGPGIVLLAWSSALAVLTLQQNRYAGDFSVVGAVLFADAIRIAAERLAGRARDRLATPIALAIAVVLLVPSIRQLHAPLIGASTRFALRGPATPRDRALDTPHGTALRFAQAVRRATPEASSAPGGGGPPGYGILCDPGLGYTIAHTARRPTPASNAGPYAGRENALAVQRFFELEDEAEAVALAQALRSPFVVTQGRPGAGAQTLMRRLHERDGRGAPRLERFRLVTEGPAAGTPLAVLAGDPSAGGQVPFKLFEIVSGAVLEVPAAPGSPVRARVVLTTPIGRAIPYEAEGSGAADGLARVRVPYATRSASDVRATGPWRVSAGGATYEVETTEADVRSGATVRAGPRP